MLGIASTDAPIADAYNEVTPSIRAARRQPDGRLDHGNLRHQSVAAGSRGEDEDRAAPCVANKGPRDHRHDLFPPVTIEIDGRFEVTGFPRPA
jgi:hypothetical protein